MPESLNNVARTIWGANATALNTYSNFVPNNAIDGDDTTQWIALNYVVGQYIQIDLGQVRSISQYRILWASNIASSVNLQSSPDGSTWTTRDTHGGINTELDTGYLTLAAGPYAFRYWRLLCNGPVVAGSPGNGNSPQIFTLELIATGLNPVARDTQESVDVLISPTIANVRSTQVVVEGLLNPVTSNIRTTQVVTEALVNVTSENLRFTQVVLEVLWIKSGSGSVYATILGF